MSALAFDQLLNDEQLAAVSAPDGPVLVIAAAGTGKTRTLTCRVAYLVGRGVPADRILLLTFTNRAAQEMLERARGLVGPEVGGLWGGTFHHSANRMLRRHASRLGYGADYSIFDQDDARRLVRQCAHELDLRGKHFPKPDVLLSLFSFAANTGKALAEVAATEYQFHAVDPADIGRVHRLYEERKRTQNAMDFDDLLLNGLRLLEDCADAREHYQERFLHVLVDEYQDTNALQARWVDLLAARHRNLLVVGDDFQSIYSWRGADFRNIITFPDRYPGTHVYKLETNYRSVPEILDVANVCIAGNPEQFQKTMKAMREDHAKPVLVQLRDGPEQARYILDQVRALRQQGYAARDIAILYRAHFHAMELQLELTRQNTRYLITSGVRFFEQAHVKDVCALLRSLANPVDELAFRRLSEMLPRVGEKTVSRIWAGLNQRMDWRQAALRQRWIELVPAAARPAATAIAGIAARHADATLDPGPAPLIQEFIKDFYNDYAAETFDNPASRMEDLQELLTFAGRFELLETFLAEMSLLTNVDAEPQPGEDAAEYLRLSTIHQAKGLEWKVVFVVWLADGLFPSSRALNVAGGEAEERRLFYVAATRARDLLYFCVPALRRQYDGSTEYCPPSRFIKELPPRLLDVRRG